MIVTRYTGATDTMGARIVATNGDRSISIGYPHEASGERAHMIAAREMFVEGLEYVAIETPDRRGYSFVPVRVIENSERYTK